MFEAFLSRSSLTADYIAPCARKISYLHNKRGQFDPYSHGVKTDFAATFWAPCARRVSELWVILFKFVEELVRVALSLNSLTCLFDCSKALQILFALSSVKLSSLRSNSWNFPVTVKTIWSLNIRFFFFRKLHAAVLVFSSVRNLPNGSWYGMVHCRAGYSILPTLLKLYRVYLNRHHLSK